MTKRLDFTERQIRAALRAGEKEGVPAVRIRSGNTTIEYPLNGAPLIIDNSLPDVSEKGDGFL